jgi:hypothetical protein
LMIFAETETPARMAGEGDRLPLVIEHPDLCPAVGFPRWAGRRPTGVAGTARA